jgi:hypothetical protein
MVADIAKSTRLPDLTFPVWAWASTCLAIPMLGVAESNQELPLPRLEVWIIQVSFGPIAQFRRYWWAANSKLLFQQSLKRWTSVTRHRDENQIEYEIVGIGKSSSTEREIVYRNQRQFDAERVATCKLLKDAPFQVIWPLASLQPGNRPPSG